MARAYSSSNSLTRLVSSPVFNLYILMRVSPCKFGESSALEDTLVGEHEMATLSDDAVDLLVQGHDLILELIEPHRLSLWGIEDLDLLHPDPRLLHQFCHCKSRDSSVWKLPVEEAATHFNSIRCLLLQGLGRCNVLEFLISDIGARYSRLIVELLEVLGRLLLYAAKVLLLGRHYSLVGLLEQLANRLP
jgi:hypothetical protein